MSIFPSISNRQSNILSLRYNTALFFIFFLGYIGFHFLHIGVAMPSVFFVLFGILAPLSMSWLSSMVICERYVDKKLTLDKNIEKELFLGAPLLSKSLKMNAYYYPAVQASYLPIFSSHLIMNPITAIYALIFMITGIVTPSISNIPDIADFLLINTPSLLSRPILTVCLLIITCIFFAWLYGAALSAVALLKIKEERRFKEKRYIEMKYTHSYMFDLVDNLSEEKSIVFYHKRDVPRRETYDVMKKLVNDGCDAAERLNDLIAVGYANPEIMVHEIATIERVVNTFVVTSITTTNEFFSKHKDNIKAAESVYRNDIEPKIHTAAVELNDQLIAVRKTIFSLEKKQNQDNLAAEVRIAQANKEKINIDNELAILNEAQPLPVPEFKDFHTLEFSNEQNKIAAANIIKTSLPTLIDAKLKATNESDKQKLDKQINKVKNFVKSIADNTIESRFRNAKRLALEKENPLYLSSGKDSSSDIDNTIAINDRYLDSYDNTLPLSED